LADFSYLFSQAHSRLERFVVCVIMEGVNVLTKEVDANGVPHPSTNVDYHLSILLASHLSNPDLTPQEIADASRCTAAAAAIAAKAARATADEKAAAAAKAVAAAKTALDLIASFPPNQGLVQDACLHKDKKMKKKHVAADLLFSKDDALPSKLQLGGVVSQGIVSNSSSSCQHKNDDQCAVPTCSRERLNTEHAVSKRVEFDGLGMELDTDRLNESVNGEGAKEEIQVTRKRGRPKSK